MRIYLAHPILARKAVRERELRIEQRTGVELHNPFYDTGRGDIEEIDAGARGLWEIDPARIVTGDVADIRRSHALAAVLCDGQSIGTIMEIVYAWMANKRVYIIDLANKGGHPWIRFHANMIFPSWEEFEAFLTHMNGPPTPATGGDARVGSIHCVVCGAICPDGDEWFQDDWQRKHREQCKYQEKKEGEKP